MTMIFEVISVILTFQRTCLLKYSQNRIDTKYESTSKYVSIPAVAQSKAWVCGPSLAGILASNPGEYMDFCL